MQVTSPEPRSASTATSRPTALRILLAGLGLAALTAGPAFPQAAAQPPAAARFETPIQEVQLTDGMRRYAVSILVNGQEMRAGLDSGSTGLRILERAVDKGAATGTTDESYGYGSGTRLDGVIGRADISIAGRAGKAPVQWVRTIGCNADHHDCPAAHIAIADFGIQGDGLKDEGFPAILGINVAEARVANPLGALGVHRWIIELPRPGERGPGRLVLNPSDEEAAGYTRVKMLASARTPALHDSVGGCLQGRHQDAVCGAVLFDTGAPGIRILNSKPAKMPWQSGDALSLVVGEPGHAPVATEDFAADQVAHASRLSFAQQVQPPGTTLYVGLLPYFGFSVLYDADKNEIGLKPRPPLAGAPVGRLAAAP